MFISGSGVLLRFPGGDLEKVLVAQLPSYCFLHYSEVLPGSGLLWALEREGK